MIEVRNLHRYFGDLHAVRGLNFCVEPGEVLGFLGPNGAGKSTTMKMIVGFLAPSDGSVSIFGHDAQRQRREAQQLIGYLPEGAPSYEDMSVVRFLEFVAQIRGLKGMAVQSAVDAALGAMNLERVVHPRIDGSVASCGHSHLSPLGPGGTIEVDFSRAAVGHS